MVTPLHLSIALHYHVTGHQWPDLRNTLHRRYAEYLANAGLLKEQPSDCGPMFEATPALAVWIEEILATPFPVQKWVIPERPQASRGQTEGGA